MANGNIAASNPNEPTRWEIMARERNARVIRCNTPDTYSWLDLSRNADRVVRALRNKLFVSLEPEQVVPLLARHKQAMIDLSDLLEEMSVTCEMEYKTPRSILRMKGIVEEPSATADTTTKDKSSSPGKTKKPGGNGSKNAGSNDSKDAGGNGVKDTVPDS